MNPLTLSGRIWLVKLLLCLLAFLVLSLFSPKTVLATNYYVDTTITDTYVASGTPDSTSYDHISFVVGSGTDSVFKTIADINAATFTSDDNILFRRGQSWRAEALIVPSSGTTGHPITFGAFGSGNNPLFDPNSEFNDFVLDSGSIWRRSQYSATNVYQLFEDGNRLIYKPDKASMVAGSFAVAGGSPGTVYVWPSDSGNPNTGHVIEHVNTQNGSLDRTIRFNGKSHLVFDSIDVSRSAIAAYNTDVAYNADLTGTQVADIVIKNCTVSFTGIRSILLGANGSGTSTFPIDITVTNVIGHDDLDVPFWVGNGTRLSILNSTSYNSGLDVAPNAKNYPNSGTYQHFPNGILISGRCVDCLVAGNYVHDSYVGAAILDELSLGFHSSRTIIERNHVDTSATTIGAVSIAGTNTTVRNNWITTGSGYGIQLNGSPTVPLVYHNTIISAPNAAHSIDTNSQPGLILKNNIFVRSGASNRFVSVPALAKTNFVSDYNVYYQTSGTARWFWGPTEYTSLATWQTNSGQDAHSLITDPAFITNYTDLRLRSTSQLINAGVELGVTNDYTSASRPQQSAPEIGAYEFVPLTVTINQKSDQVDPTTNSPINFTIVFSSSVSDFDSTDITISGTAGANTAQVTGSGTTYNAAISGMTNDGTVIVSIAQGRATSAAGDTNAVSTSSDDTVTFRSTSPEEGSHDTSEDHSPANSSSQTNSQTKPASCTDPVSSDAPNIFEIQTTPTSATLYFVPPSMPYSSFYITYSQTTSNWNYGVEFKQGKSSGAVKYTINELSPNTRYYFQVRSGNGCATGPWGNIMSGTTKSLARSQTSKAVLAPTVTKLVPVITEQPQAPLIDKPVNNGKIQDQKASSKKSSRYCLLWWCF